jgi:hypothetical protein
VVTGGKLGEAAGMGQARSDSRHAPPSKSMHRRRLTKSMLCCRLSTARDKAAAAMDELLVTPHLSFLNSQAPGMEAAGGQR